MEDRYEGLRELSVLYVEDDDTLREALGTYLKKICKEVYHAPDGVKGLELFKEYFPDIVITDIDMPNMSGVEMSRLIKSISPNTNILIITGFGDSRNLLDAISIGVDYYAIKPLEMDKFENSLLKIAYKSSLIKNLQDANHFVSQYQKIVNSSAIYSKADPKGIITYVNDRFCNVSGYKREELLGKSQNIVRHPDMPKETFEHLWKTIRGGKIWRGIVKNRKKDGTTYVVDATIAPIMDANGKIVEYTSIRYEITDLVHANERMEGIAKEYEHIAQQKSDELLSILYKDENTGLNNILALQRDIRTYKDGTLYLLDVNNFNIFNKLHGFSFGDRMLAEIAQNLKHITSEDETLYKMGADRFAILSKAYDQERINDLCNGIFAYFDNAEISIDMIDNIVTFSIGVARVEESRDTIISAEFALDVSKRHGKRFRVIYSKENEEMNKERENITWLKTTRDYIVKDMIVPYYQPIVDVKTEKIYKYESLARVMDGDIIITPDRFLGAAKRLGLLSAITKSMINKTFFRFSGTDIKFSINITERDIMDGYLMEFIKLKTEKFNINPANVTFEILENLTLAKDGDFIAGTISLVKDFGCQIAIDDFGSENSNFSRLLSLKSDYLKIDGSFVVDCDKDAEKQKIISAIVQLARRLDIKTVAEYVSTKEIFETIKEIGVDYAQGYYVGKPQSSI